MSDKSYKDNDDLGLYNNIIKEITINHKNNTISFKILKLFAPVEGDIYNTQKGELVCKNILFSTISYNLLKGESGELYRSAVLNNSSLIEEIKRRPILNNDNHNIIHIYLGIDCATKYSEVDIVCSEFSLIFEKQIYSMSDPEFDWIT